jgi:hypothetical protein
VIKPKSGEIKEITVVIKEGKKIMMIDCCREHWQANATFVSELTNDEINKIKNALNNPIKINPENEYAGEECLTIGCHNSKLPHKDYCSRHD